MIDPATIPYDVWHLIFRLVCTDGGASGCTLARTSKSFRALSASVRFHSLTLTSLAEVKNFLICLERIRRFNASGASSPSTASNNDAPASPAPIHHLLLSFLQDTCDAPQRTFRKWTDYARDERSLVFQLANDHKTWAAAKTAWNRDFVLHVSRLLQLAAPTLHSLVLLQCPEVRLPLVHCQYGFPALRELTLLGDDRTFVRLPGPGTLVSGQNDPSDFVFYGVPTAPNADADASGFVQPPFPALTHLHVVFTGPKLHPWEHTLPRWAALAPALTHLRISQGNSRLPPVLREMLGTRPAPSPSHPGLRVLVLQMSGARRTNISGTHAPVHELERIKDEYAGGVRFAILRTRAYVPGYWEARLRWDWRERMLGGGGCWTENEEDEDVWKVFRLESSRRPGKKGRRKNSVSVNVCELEPERERDGGSGSHEAGRSGKKWWKVLAKGLPRVRRNSSA
ncbi:hypothetical protein C8Q80DRAFT_1106502 [Daedaleopsis nitida]|nr:hypothetical protein C8Q80DRAFT_1106502 [Daedaleopsis nitida]